MSKALIEKLIAARQAGKDLRTAFEESLHEESKSDHLISGLLIFGFALSSVFLVAAVTALIIDSKALNNVPLLSIFGSVTEKHQKILIGALAAVSSSMLVAWMKHRQDQKKHAFVLFMVAEGQVRDAAMLLFSSGKAAKDGKVSLVVEALSTVVSVVT